MSGCLYLCVQFEGKVVLLLLKGRVPFRPLQATVLKPHRLVILIKRIRHSGEKGEDKLFFSKQLTSAFFYAILCPPIPYELSNGKNKSKIPFFTSPLHVMLSMCIIALFFCLKNRTITLICYLTFTNVTNVDELI